jgi:hypothetical protein
VDGDGNVYVVDGGSNNRIEKFTATGTYLTQWGVAWPEGVAVDRGGNVYVATNLGGVEKFTATGTLLAQWGDDGSGNGQLHNPWLMAADSADNVYVADTGNKRIEKFSATGTFLSVIGSGSIAPNGVAVDAGGNVYVSDVGAYRIVVFAPGVVTPLATLTATSTSTTTPTLTPTRTPTLTATPEPMADLIVSSVSAPPSSIPAGGTFSVTDTTVNQGTVAVGPSVTGYFLWQQIGNVFVPVGRRGVPDLAGGQSSSGSGLATVPSTTAPGWYYLAVCANRGERASEGNLANDCRLGSTQVHVSAAATLTPTPVPG